MKCLIYISYDRDEYVNYFHLAVDEQFVMNSIPVDMVGRLFSEIKRYCTCKNTADWYIMADCAASDWDFRTTFQENGIILSCTSEWNDSEICKFLNRSGTLLIIFVRKPITAPNTVNTK